MSLFRHKKSRDKRPVTVFPYAFPGLTSLLRRPASHEHFGHLATASIAGTLPDAASAPDLLLLSKLKLHFNHDINSVGLVSDADETSITEGIQHETSGMPVLVNAADALQPSGRPSIHMS